MVDPTGSFITHGDQRKERDLKVANGFPEVLMSQTDAIVSQELLDMLELSQGDAMNIQYDILKLLPSSMKSFETLIFDYKP